MRLAPWNGFKPSSKIFFTYHSKAVLHLWIICIFVSCVSNAFASFHCCLVVTCWERDALLALVGDVYYIFVTLPCGILGQVWYLIVSFPALCRLSNFVMRRMPFILLISLNDISFGHVSKCVMLSIIFPTICL